MNSVSEPSMAVQHLLRARLPRCLLPLGWPCSGQVPALADIDIAAGRIARIAAHAERVADQEGVCWDLAGALVLTGLVDAHVHLDKTFTISRMGAVTPGLLGAIDAMMTDKALWTPEDLHARASRALRWAHQAGSVHLRTHCDWWEPDRVPLAWPVLQDLAQQWRAHLRLERVSLSPLELYESPDWAWAIARAVAASGPDAVLGGFVHSTNFSETALRHLLQAAQHHGLDVDLHCDEELNPEAQGLATVARLMAEMDFEGRVVCGHTCALAAKSEDDALRILDAVAGQRITLIALPATNLILQDAHTERTPRLRGLTLLKEARARGIPVLLASDNVQDPFCPMGSYDPLEALLIGAPMGQLRSVWDEWSDTICKAAALSREASALPLHVGARADFVVLPDADAWGFPSRTQPRVVLRAGELAHGVVPSHWRVSTQAQKEFA